MLPLSVTLNGVRAEDLGFKVIAPGPTGWLSLPERQFKTAPLVLRDGVALLSTASTSSPRTIGLRYYRRSASIAERRDRVNALFRAMPGLIEVAVVDDPAKVCYSVLQRAPVTIKDPVLLNTEAMVDAQLFCADPLWYMATPSSVAIPLINTPVALALSTASARTRKLLLILNGAFTTPITAILKNAANEELQRMTLADDGANTIACSASEYVAVDCDAGTITKYSAGVALDRTSCLSVTHDFFTVDPLDAPALQVDKGTALAYYTPASLA